MTLVHPGIADPGTGHAAARIASVTSPAPRATWSRLAAADPTSMVDHTPAWTDAIVASGPYRDVSCLYELTDGRQFVLPLVQRTGTARLAGISASFPEGWGFGGVVGPGRDAGVIRAILADLAERRDVHTRLRPNPLEADLWAEGAPPDVVSTPKRAHVLDLAPGVDALREGMHPSARRALRKAERSAITLTTDASSRRIEDYYLLYQRSLARWAATSHEPGWLASWRGRRRDPIEKLHTLAALLGDRFRLYLTYVDGQPAAGQIVLLGNAAHDTRGAMDKELANPVRATFLIQWQAIVDAAEAGCTALHLGESGTSTTLARYKEHYGARSVPYRDYRIERLPLTRGDALLRGAVKRLIGFQEG